MHFFSDFGFRREEGKPPSLFCCECIYSLGIALVFFSLPFSSTNTFESIGVIFALLGWTISASIKKDWHIKGNPLNLPLSLACLTILSSFLTANDLSYAINELRGEFLTYSLLFYAMVYFCRDRKMLYRIFVIFLVCNILTLFLYIYLFYSGDFHSGRLLIFFNTRKLFAEGTPKLSTYFLVCTCLNYAALYFAPQKKHLLGLLLLLIGNLIFMGLTYQGAVFVAMVFVLPIPLCFFRVIPLKRYWILAAVILSLGLVFMFTPVKSKFSYKYWQSITQWQIEDTNRKDIDIRVKLIADFWHTFHDRLYIGAGYGKGNMTKTVQEKGEYIAGMDSHNTFLNTIGQTGLQGLAALLYILFIQSRILWEGARKAQNAFDQFIFIGTFCCMIGFWIRMMCNDLYRGAPALMYWMLMGLAFGLWLLVKDEQVQCGEASSA